MIERVFSRIAIPGLIRFVVALNAVVFLFSTLQPKFVELLVLDRAAILQGEVWRLVSWMFIPDASSLLWVAIYLMFLWWIGDLLESAWGVVRLNAYYFTGASLCVLSALVFGSSLGSVFLNLSLFFAVATLAPNLEILVLFIIPMKIKWVALFSLIAPALMLLFGSLAVKMMVLMCLGNYLIFFGPGFVREAFQNRKTLQRRSRFESAKYSEPNLHHCEVCGITELTNPDAEFRVASDGKEYCTQHLRAAIGAPNV